MTKTVLHGRPIVNGIVEGEALVVKSSFNFGACFYQATLTGAKNIIVSDPNNELYGKQLTGKILVYSTQHGSTGVSGALMGIIHKGLGPKAIICNEIDPMMAAGVIFAEKILDKKVPTIDNLNDDVTRAIDTGNYVKVDGDKGIIEITKS